jgi:hypothetical protein
MKKRPSLRILNFTKHIRHDGREEALYNQAKSLQSAPNEKVVFALRDGMNYFLGGELRI